MYIFSFNLFTNLSLDCSDLVQIELNKLVVATLTFWRLWCPWLRFANAGLTFRTIVILITMARISGITKFSQLSIFCELNSLTLISMMDAYASICGITEEEMRTQMKPEIEEFAQSQGITFDQACDNLKRKYDGYHFSKKSPDIYNPFSLMRSKELFRSGSHCLQHGRKYNHQRIQFRQYWTGNGRNQGLP